MSLSTINDFLLTSAMDGGRATGNRKASPPLDFIVTSLAAAGMVKLITQASAPTGDASSVWLKPAAPSYSDNGIFYGWNGTVWVTLTPALFAGILFANHAATLPFGTTTGTATAVASALSPALTELKQGQAVIVHFLTNVDMANATTFAPNGLPAAPLLNIGGGAAGTIANGSTALLIYEFSTWRVLLAQAGTTTSGAVFPFAASAGTSTAVTAACAPAVAALAAGAIASFTCTTAIDLSVATTFSPNGLTAAPLRDSTGVASGTIGIGQLVIAEYDGTNWRVVAGLSSSFEVGGKWLLVHERDCSVSALTPGTTLAFPSSGITVPAGYKLTNKLQCVIENLVKANNAANSQLTVYGGDVRVGGGNTSAGFMFSAGGFTYPGTAIDDASATIGYGKSSTNMTLTPVPRPTGATYKWTLPISAETYFANPASRNADAYTANIGYSGTGNIVGGKVRLYAWLAKECTDAQIYGE